jgi:hypothetical protein
VLPDHWVPLAVVGRTQRYSLARVARLSGAAGVAHVLVSLGLGAVIVVVGLQFRSTVEHAQNAIVGGLLIATAVLFLAFELTGRGHGHSHDGHSHDHPHHDSGAHDHHAGGDHHHAGAHDHGHHHHHRSLLAVMVPFGAAASPDLTILPVFLAATAAGTGAAVASLIAFAGVTIATIVTLTVSATIGGYRIRGRWLERGGNVLTAAVLAVIGALVLAGVL